MPFVHHQGDLFQLAPAQCKAHCVSADLAMGAGIAKQFRSLYGRPNTLGYKPSVGSCVPQKHQGQLGTRYTFHLVTKEKYWQKPTLYTMRRALEALKEVLECLEIKELWIPQIGAGLDKLRWESVLELLEEILANWTGTLHIVTYA